MDFDKLIADRLMEISQTQEPDGSPWPEGCHGSRRALVIFIGPSPGGRKEEQRSERELNQGRPIWNEPFWDPVKFWSTGFQLSFQPIVETITGLRYEQSGKLIAVLNLDWIANPESRDVPRSAMREGCAHILPIIAESRPSLIIPMDIKTFNEFQDALIRDAFDLDPVLTEEILIKGQSRRDSWFYHRYMMAFTAEKNDQHFVVIKSLQHPARIFEKEYALRVGKAIRLAADQIWQGKAISMDIA